MKSQHVYKTVEGGSESRSICLVLTAYRANKTSAATAATSFITFITCFLFGGGGAFTLKEPGV